MLGHNDRNRTILNRFFTDNALDSAEMIKMRM